MRGWVIAWALLMLMSAPPAAAQGASAVASCTKDAGTPLDAKDIFKLSFDRRGAQGDAPRQLNLRSDREARLSATSLHLVLEPGETPGIEWARIRLLSAARTAEHVTLKDGSSGPEHTPLFARLHGHGAGAARIELDLPQGSGYRFSAIWHSVIAVCDTANDRLIAYGSIDVRVHSRLWSGVLAGGFLLLIYGTLAALALKLHTRRLTLVAQSLFAGEMPRIWPWQQALNPVFMTQDAAGIGSLARLQLLVFTLAVVFVYAYVLARTGELAALSADVLSLLGITILGSGLARLVGDSGSVSVANRSWLKARGLLRHREDRMPTFSDLVCADGEIEIARVQAIIFSSLTVVALLIKGPSDLGGFTISTETLYLLGLSQAAYVAGKAIPAEGVRRLNAEVTALRNAEREWQDLQQQPPGAASAESLARARGALNGAVLAAEDTLVDVYGEALDRVQLNALRVP